jgi:hypothetical protein
MLQYLRNPETHRVVWIDAICINQESNEEREAQVAKMRIIYQRCSKVVLYLGSDVVKLVSGSHRQRHEIYEIGRILKRDQAEVLKIIFGRKYFTRLWIIQELVISPRVVLPFADHDFYMGRDTTRRLSQHMPSWNWSDFDIPWMEHLSNGSETDDNLFETLRKTWKTNATDPRDKIFGVTGLAFGTPGVDIPRPDYTITSRHCFIGIMAYFIIHEKKLDLLFSAAGAHATRPMLSWLPHYRRWADSSIKGKEPVLSLLTNDPGAVIPLDPFWAKPSMSTALELQMKSSWSSNWASIDASTGHLTMRLIHILTNTAGSLNIRLEDNDGIVFTAEKAGQTISVIAQNCGARYINKTKSLALFLSDGVDPSDRYLLVMDPTERKHEYRLIVCLKCLSIRVNAPGGVSVTKRPQRSQTETVADSSSSPSWRKGDPFSRFLNLTPLPRKTLVNAVGEALYLLTQLTQNPASPSDAGYFHENTLSNEQMIKKLLQTKVRISPTGLSMSDLPEVEQKLLCWTCTVQDGLLLAQLHIDNPINKPYESFGPMKTLFFELIKPFAATTIPRRGSAEYVLAALNKNTALATNSCGYPCALIIDDVKWRTTILKTSRRKGNLFGRNTTSTSWYERTEWRPVSTFLDNAAGEEEVELEFRSVSIVKGIQDSIFYRCLKSLSCGRRFTGKTESEMLLNEPKEEFQRIPCDDWPENLDDLGVHGLYRNVSIV